MCGQGVTATICESMRHAHPPCEVSVTNGPDDVGEGLMVPKSSRGMVRNAGM